MKQFRKVYLEISNKCNLSCAFCPGTARKKGAMTVETFRQALLAVELPLTIGGGIGQSRLCMLMMGCAHIGEVQSSIWDDMTRKTCQEAGVMLL